jgi:RNase adaptor protein for sRNA GlmZ degradation
VESSGNGGGFVFDCRFLHNPGRYEPYKKLSGKDESVINFLKHFSEMEPFLNNVYRMVDAAVENYLERSFTHLEINFGCTGGQHRSVYAADQLTAHLKDKYGIDVTLNHLEQANWSKEN